MAGRISTKLVALTLVLASHIALAQQATIVSYDFDGGLLQSGPDTFQVFRNNLNKAELSYELAHSGSASIHLTDPVGDLDFVEFQGYFAPQDSGVLTLGFSFLITGEENAFSVALTGERKYQLHKRGINFWLTYDGEWLRNYNNSIPKKVLRPEAFHWYTVRTELNFDVGRQNLLIMDEYGDVVYEAEALPMAPGVHNIHTVQEFSIVGDIYDKVSSDFFIDSFFITSSTSLPRKLVAPGRRMLFVDRWNDYQATVQGKLRCLPAINLDDIGIDDEDLAAIFTGNEMDALLRLTSETWQDGNGAVTHLHPGLQALTHWRRACELLEKTGERDPAIDSIEEALAIAPDAYIYRLTDIIIRSHAMDPAELLYRLSEFRTGDIRAEIALAMMATHYEIEPAANGFYVPDLSTGFSERMLALKPAQKYAVASDPWALSLQQLQAFMPEDWEAWMGWSVAMEFQYMALLGNRNYAQAGELAEEVAMALEELSLPDTIWWERVADTALLLDQPQRAIEGYEQIQSGNAPGRVNLKLSDAYFMLGDYEKERSLRESIYRNFSGR